MEDIKGYEGLYGITSCGKVWSYRSKKFLKPFYDKDGYQIVSLCKDGEMKKKKIHRLVADTYIQNPNCLQQVNHKDEIKTHNWIKNLEWCDAKYNINYSNAKRVKCIETGQIFNSIKEAAFFIKRDGSNISKCLKGKYFTCGGYHWEYVKEGL